MNEIVKLSNRSTQSGKQREIYVTWKSAKKGALYELPSSGKAIFLEVAVEELEDLDFRSTLAPNSDS